MEIVTLQVPLFQFVLSWLKGNISSQYNQSFNKSVWIVFGKHATSSQWDLYVSLAFNLHMWKMEVEMEKEWVRRVSEEEFGFEIEDLRFKIEDLRFSSDLRLKI